LLQDLDFYNLALSPVFSASTSSSSTTSESCSASESTLEEEEEEGYDAPAYTERTTALMTRHTADFATRHTPAAADFAQPRAHRPMAYLSSPALVASDDGRESDEGDAEMVYVSGSSKARDHRAAPQHADHSSSDTRHSSGDTHALSLPTPPRMRTCHSGRRSNCNLSADA
jgi:hypothetical protein